MNGYDYTRLTNCSRNKYMAAPKWTMHISIFRLFALCAINGLSGTSTSLIVRFTAIVPIAMASYNSQVPIKISRKYVTFV